MPKVNFQVFPAKLVTELKSKGWNDVDIQKIKVPKSYRKYSVSSEYVAFDNTQPRLIKGNIWKACTEFHSSTGSSPYKMLTFEKIGEKIKKSIYNVYLQTVKPSDGINNSDYKAVIAAEAKKISMLG